MLELHVADRTRRGEIDGRSLRPSGIVARPAAAYAGFATAWMSDIFRQLARGHDFAVPTSADAALWLESVGAVADDIIHAARMPAEGLPPHRAWTLPATVATLRELTNTILAETGSRAAVAFAPSGMNQPALDNSDALAAGFRGDGSVTALVRAVLRQLDSKS
jgi:nucleoside-diphosphate-sugar epimerase